MARYAGKLRAVVDQLFGDMQWYAQPGHRAGEVPAEVVQHPVGDATRFIEAALGFAPTVELEGAFWKLIPIAGQRNGVRTDLPPDIRAIANWNFPPLNA